MLRSSTFAVASLSDIIRWSYCQAIFSTKQIYVDEYNVDVDVDKDEDGDDGGDDKDDGSQTLDGCISSEMTSTGTGKIIVLLFSADMLFSVCRYLNYK